jgi:outer membrane immunogenic protein
MKKILMATAVLATVATSANAADMLLKAPPPPPGFDWNGWYVGANVGYSWGRSWSDVTGTTLVPSTFGFTTSTNMDGVLGGGQIGYNWLYNGNGLLGVEADIQGTGQRGTAYGPTYTFTPIGVAALSTVNSSGTLQQSLPWFGTLRARAGFLPNNHWLLYVTGGLAVGEVNSTATATTLVLPAGTAFASSGSASNTQAGWTVGGGAEWWLGGQWTAKAEYLYIDLGHITNTFNFTGFVSSSFATATVNSHITDNIFRVGVDYHFAH